MARRKHLAAAWWCSRAVILAMTLIRSARRARRLSSPQAHGARRECLVVFARRPLKRPQRHPGIWPRGCGRPLCCVHRRLARLNRLLQRRRHVCRTGHSAPHERPIGYVFQEASLFPHLSVMRNLVYGAPKTDPAGRNSEIRFDEVIELLGLAALLGRSPQNLSGGERQRVAIGRALLSQPKLLLMDEPLSALDRLTKDEVLPFLERLHETLSLPVIYVSHDMAEVERLADHLVLMEAGRVIASGPLTALQSDPTLPLMKARDAAVSLDAVADIRRSHGLVRLPSQADASRFPRRRLPRAVRPHCGFSRRCQPCTRKTDHKAPSQCLPAPHPRPRPLQAP